MVVALLLATSDGRAQDLLELVKSLDTQAHVLAFSPDNHLLAAGSGHSESIGAHGEVTLWSVPDLAPIAELKGHRADVIGLGFTPNSKRLVSGASEIIVWEIEEKTMVLFKKGVGLLHTFVLSPDGRLAVTISRGDKRARIWEVSTGKSVASIYSKSGREPTEFSWIRGVAFYPSGLSLATLDIEGSLRVWKCSDWTMVPPARVLEVTNGFELMRYSPVENKLFALDSIGVMYDMTGGPEVVRLERRDFSPGDAAYSPDGRYVAIAEWTIIDSGSLSVWDVGTGKLLQTIARAYRSVSYSPDGKFLAAGRKGGGIDLYKVKSR